MVLAYKPLTLTLPLAWSSGIGQEPGTGISKSHSYAILLRLSRIETQQNRRFPKSFLLGSPLSRRKQEGTWRMTTIPCSSKRSHSLGKMSAVLEERQQGHIGTDISICEQVVAWKTLPHSPNTIGKVFGPPETAGIAPPRMKIQSTTAGHGTKVRTRE